VAEIAERSRPTIIKTETQDQAQAVMQQISKSDLRRYQFNTPALFHTLFHVATSWNQFDKFSTTRVSIRDNQVTIDASRGSSYWSRAGRNRVRTTPRTWRRGN
jgi:hypothetical protein